jgi:hypothetical protein
VNSTGFVGAQGDPVLGREVVERQQDLAVVSDLREALPNVAVGSSGTAVSTSRAFPTGVVAPALLEGPQKQK